MTNHLGNVLAVVSDRKLAKAVSGTAIQWFEADVLSSQQYYAFGMLMPGRQYSAAGYDYRFGFNGKEGDDEIKGDDNQQDYGMRIYDPRVGRFLSVDPIAGEYPWYTPYQFAGNKPIWAVDLDGLEELIYDDIFTKFYQEVPGALQIKKLVESTNYFKEFQSALKNQSKYDVFVFFFPAQNNIGTRAKISKSGFIEGGGLGRTQEVSSLKDLEGIKKNDRTISFVDANKVSKSFSNGKKVILVGIAVQFAMPYDNRAFPDMPPTEEFIKNAEFEGALALNHELWGHARPTLLKGENTTTQEQDHELLNGVNSPSSPDNETVIKQNSPYKGTHIYKMAREILKKQGRDNYYSPN